jgi:hypothetical protein
MACPDCGSSLGNFRISTSIETHGLDCGPFERFDQEFILCRNCGGKFDVSDWDDTPELSKADSRLLEYASRLNSPTRDVSK